MDTTLVQMFEEVRGVTLRMLEGVDEQVARWHPPGLANSILWHAGHCYVVVEWLTMLSLGRDPEAPAGWFELFSWDSRPAETPGEKYPPLAAVVPHLQRQHVRLRQLLSTLTEEHLARPSAEWPNRTAQQMILHAFQDEASHKGEIWLLRKLQSTAVHR